MRVFHILLDKSVEEFVQVLETETKASRDGVVRLANYLPVATKEAEKIAHGVPNRYFQVHISGYGGGGGVEWVGCYCIRELGYGGIETGKADGLVGFTSSEFNCIFTTPWSNERYD